MIYKKIDLGKKGEYYLSEPTFEILKLAASELITADGKTDIVGAGEVIFKGCYQGNNGSLDEIMKDVKLYFNLCRIAYEEIELWEGELKKNTENTGSVKKSGTEKKNV